MIAFGHPAAAGWNFIARPCKAQTCRLRPASEDVAQMPSAAGRIGRRSGDSKPQWGKCHSHDRSLPVTRHVCFGKCLHKRSLFTTLRDVFDWRLPEHRANSEVGRITRGCRSTGALADGDLTASVGVSDQDIMDHVEYAHAKHARHRRGGQVTRAIRPGEPCRIRKLHPWEACPAEAWASSCIAPANGLSTQVALSLA